MSAECVLIYVQHLLGIGHLMRAATLARAFAAAGFETNLVSGGMPVAPLPLATEQLIQLPPVRAKNGNFSLLADEAGNLVDEAYRTTRRERLLSILRAKRPNVLIFETFPFGRRQMRFELLPLLEAALAMKPRPLIAASVRDILQTPKPGRAEEAVALAMRGFDLVLVHGDPALVTFEASFPLAAGLGEKLRYTGYIAGPPVARGKPGDAGWNEVIVSAGGGAVGGVLLATAFASRPSTRLRDATWRFLVGRGAEDAELERLAAMQDNGVVVERARPDFRQLLANCRVSISQAGYNTVIDVMSAGARSVLAPFSKDGETEQTMRATRLAQHHLAAVVLERTLSPRSLAAAVDHADAMKPDFGWINRRGAEASVRIVREALRTRHSHPAAGV
ncbi:MAG TPA: glycosyltransferase [Alphaproteobacteria bacterium]|nr:glycosyltransferase [Alphaproteobacteria bacterium]